MTPSERSWDSAGAAASQRLAGVVVRIVDQHDVDAIETQSLEAPLDRAPAPRPGCSRGPDDESRARRSPRGRALQCCQRVRATGRPWSTRRRRRAGSARSVRRVAARTGRGRSAVRCRSNGSPASHAAATAASGLLVGGGPVQVADLRAAEPELGEAQAAVHGRRSHRRRLGVEPAARVRGPDVRPRCRAARPRAARARAIAASSTVTPRPGTSPRTNRPSSTDMSTVSPVGGSRSWSSRRDVVRHGGRRVHQPDRRACRSG